MVVTFYSFARATRGEKFVQHPARLRLKAMASD